MINAPIPSNNCSQVAMAVTLIHTSGFYKEDFFMNRRTVRSCTSPAIAGLPVSDVINRLHPCSRPAKPAYDRQGRCAGCTSVVLDRDVGSDWRECRKSRMHMSDCHGWQECSLCMEQ
jgi:hypothetical protein